MKHFDFLVFIGRFQPFHSGHLTVVKRALSESERLIILCGSAHQPRSIRNPWTVSEREQMIRAALTSDENTRVDILPLMDVLYNDEIWIRNVQSTVNGIVTAQHARLHKQANVGLIGHSKDNSSYYLSLFPQWKGINVPSHQDINATALREQLFTTSQVNTDSTELPQTSTELLNRFFTSEPFKTLSDEYAFIQAYKKTWASAPYAPTFVTVDAVVVQSGHVLLVKRRARPGKGLFALPGGFVDPNETLLQACLRELKEETRIKVPMPVLKGNIKSQQSFDDPYRSSRGRTISNAFLIELPAETTLPKVKGGDDAENALWMPLSNLNPEYLFEDHYFIIQAMLGMH